jgi:hypothetical protein
MTPALDLDIMSEEAVLAAEDIVRWRVKHEAVLLVRVGNPPKRAIPFRTDEPFKKLTVLFEGDEKLEFLADGQQLCVAGVHPDTGQPYRWLGRELWTVPREDLPTISGAEATAMVDEIVEMLCQHYGYLIKTSTTAPPKAAGGSTLHVSFSSASAGQAKHQVPVPLYKKMVDLMQPGIGQVRARGILKPVVEARENRNKLLYSAALQFRELIRDGIITRSAVEELLYLTSEINGYVSKRGRKQTEDTIKSGLEAVHYGREGLEKET